MFFFVCQIVNGGLRKIVPRCKFEERYRRRGKEKGIVKADEWTNTVARRTKNREISSREEERSRNVVARGRREEEAKEDERVSKPEQTIHTSLASPQSTWKRC